MQMRFRLTTLAAGWVGSLVGLILILPLGLIVLEWIIFPLALMIAAILAALGTGWAGTYLAHDETRTRLEPVVGSTVVVAVVLALLFLVLVSVGVASFGPLFVPALLFSAILALSASIATWRYRRPRQNSAGDGRLTVALLVLATVSVPCVVFLAASFGLAGA